MIVEKKEAPVEEVKKQVGAVLDQNVENINDFKLGKLSEKEFTDKMIDALEKETNIRLSTDEFDRAWNELNPTFSQFEELLKQLVEYNKTPHQQVILISFTNPKEIRYLIEVFNKNNIKITTVHNELIKIDGIPLYTTYAKKLSKEELIETVIKQVNTYLSDESYLANSFKKFMTPQMEESKLIDIKYIRGVNSIQDPVLKADLDQTNQEVEKKAEKYFVDTILWMKKEKTLSQVLQDDQAVSQMILVSKL